VPQAWVDFNNIHENCTTTLYEFVDEGVELYLGAVLSVGDEDGNVCEAVVTSLEFPIVGLELRMKTFFSDKDFAVPVVA